MDVPVFAAPDIVFTATCHYCDEPVDVTNWRVWQRIVGWERKTRVRDTGTRGGSDITLREPRDEYACPDCVAKLQAGIHAGQGSLV
jgi:hypothetical protein